MCVCTYILSFFAHPTHSEPSKFLSRDLCLGPTYVKPSANQFLVGERKVLNLEGFTFACLGAVT